MNETLLTSIMAGIENHMSCHPEDRFHGIELALGIKKYVLYHMGYKFIEFSEENKKADTDTLARLLRTLVEGA